MTEHDTEDTAAASNAENEPTTDDSNGLDVSGHNVRRYAAWGAFAICGLLAVIAALQLYLSVDRLVSIWIAHEFQPAFRAAFNLAVLLIAGYGTFALADRLSK